MQKTRAATSVWITADVHYCAAHHYDPERRQRRILIRSGNSCGPAHAVTFAPGPLDSHVRSGVKFSGTPADLKPNRPPDAGLQFFGLLEADASGRQLTVSLQNTAGQRIFTQQLERV